MDLSKKVVLITGAGRGIGRGIALYLAKEGISIIVCDIDKQNLDIISNELKSITSNFISVQADVSKKDDVERMYEKAINKFGRIDASIQNAGVAVIAPFLEIDEKAVDRILAVNFKGVFFCCQVAIKHMLKQGYGKVINNASSAGREGFAYESIYSSSKFAVIGLTQCLAKEFGRDGIIVNAFCPGLVATDLWQEADLALGKIQGLKPGEVTKKLIESIPLNRISHPIDIAKAVAFLVSDDSNYITGQAIGVDGGLIMSK